MPRRLRSSLLLIGSILALAGVSMPQVREAEGAPGLSPCLLLAVNAANAMNDLYACESDDLMFHATGGCPEQILAVGEAISLYENYCGSWTQS